MPGITKSRLPRQQKGGVPIMLRMSVANLVMDACEALLNLRVLIPMTDGTNTLNPKEADVKMTGMGLTVTLPPTMDPSVQSGGGSANTQQFEIISDGGDYWNCLAFNGSTTSGLSVKVAKPQELRAGAGGMASELIRGTVYAYTYSAIAGATTDGVDVLEYTRSSTVGGSGTPEITFMTPPMLPGRVIVAVTFVTTAPASLVGVLWISPTACAWAK